MSKKPLEEVCMKKEKVENLHFEIMSIENELFDITLDRNPTVQVKDKESKAYFSKLSDRLGEVDRELFRAIASAEKVIKG